MLHILKRQTVWLVFLFICILPVTYFWFFSLSSSSQRIEEAFSWSLYVNWCINFSSETKDFVEGDIVFCHWQVAEKRYWDLYTLFIPNIIVLCMQNRIFVLKLFLISIWNLYYRIYPYRIIKHCDYDLENYFQIIIRNQYMNTNSRVWIAMKESGSS